MEEKYFIKCYLRIRYIIIEMFLLAIRKLVGNAFFHFHQVYNLMLEIIFDTIIPDKNLFIYG